MSSVTGERWAQLSMLEQMGNIGAEVGRAIAAERRGNRAHRDSAIARALDLFAETARLLARERSPRLREVLRARDQFLGLFFDDDFAEADKIENYFMQFALAARKDR